MIVLTPRADDQYSPFQHFLPGSETESPCRSALLYEDCERTNTRAFKVIKCAGREDTHTRARQSNHHSSNSAAASEFTAISHVLLYVPQRPGACGTHVSQFLFFFLTVIGWRGEIMEVVMLGVEGGYSIPSMSLKRLSVTPSGSTPSNPVINTHTRDLFAFADRRHEQISLREWKRSAWRSGLLL